MSRFGRATPSSTVVEQANECEFRLILLHQGAAGGVVPRHRSALNGSADTVRSQNELCSLSVPSTCRSQTA